MRQERFWQIISGITYAAIVFVMLVLQRGGR